jgi:hypothetical protein
MDTSQLQSDTDALLARHLGKVADLSYDRSLTLWNGTQQRWMKFRKRLRAQRVWWRHQYVPGASHVDTGQHFSWIADIHAGFSNPPRRRGR